MAVVAFSFDPNALKGRIEAATARQTGRSLTLGGPIQLHWGLTPVVEMDDIAFANMPGGTRPSMAVAARVELRVRLLPLAVGRLEFASIRLVQPDILLETDASGRANWLFDRPVQPSAAEPTGRSGWQLQWRVDRLDIEAGRLAMRDRSTGRTTAIDIATAAISAGHGPVRVTAAGTWAGLATQGEAAFGSVAELTSPRARSSPVTLRLSVADATLAADGTWNAASRVLAGHVAVTVPDSEKLAVALQITTLPLLHDVAASAELAAEGGWPDHAEVRVGASDLTKVLPGLSLSHAELTWPAGQPARISADGTLRALPWRLTSGLTAAGSGVALRGVTMTLGTSDVAGDLAVSVSSKLAVRGTLVSTRVDVDAFRLGKLPAVPAASAPTPALMPAPPSMPMFDGAPLPWQKLSDLDADVQWKAASLRSGNIDYGSVASHLVVQGGHLQFDPSLSQARGGRANGSLTLDATTTEATIRLQSAAFDVGPLVGVFGGTTVGETAADIDVDLHATGVSSHAMAASLEGHAGVAVVDADLPNAALSAFLGNVPSTLRAGMDGSGVSRVRCLAVRADARRGRVTLEPLKLDSSRFALSGSGTLDLGEESLDLRLRPLLRIGGAGVASAVQVAGSLRQPAVTLDPTAGRVGVTIGGLNGSQDNCASELAAARDGRAGRLPEPVLAGKPPKPADLLRSLLR